MCDSLGFAVAVDMTSQKLAVVPMKNQSMSSWEGVVSFLFQTYFESVHTFVSDREATFTSEKFRKMMKARFSIDWYFMHVRNKAFLAERMIRYVKKRLSMSMSINKTNQWVQFVEPLTKHFNGQHRTGTHMKRNAIIKHNFLEMLNQLHKVDDVTHLFNISTSYQPPPPKYAKRIFKYKVGSFVLLRRKSDYATHEKQKTFDKPSMIGAFGGVVYTIERRLLKNSANLFLTPVYKLTGKLGYFYERELTLIYIRRIVNNHNSSPIRETIGKHDIFQSSYFKSGFKYNTYTDRLQPPPEY
jgi:hypothetical protein